MRHSFRSYLAIMLSLLLVLTGHSMAVARGMPGVAGQIEICSGTGPVMIALDAEGNPTGPAHICPEAALSLIQASMVSPDVLIAVTGSVARVAYVQAASGTGSGTARPQARGPPAIA